MSGRRKLGEWSPDSPMPRVETLKANPRTPRPVKFAVDAAGNLRRVAPDNMNRAARRAWGRA